MFKNAVTLAGVHTHTHTHTHTQYLYLQGRRYTYYLSVSLIYLKSPIKGVLI